MHNAWFLFTAYGSSHVFFFTVVFFFVFIDILVLFVVSKACGWCYHFCFVPVVVCLVLSVSMTCVFFYILCSDEMRVFLNILLCCVACFLRYVDTVMLWCVLSCVVCFDDILCFFALFLMFFVFWMKCGHFKIFCCVTDGVGHDFGPLVGMNRPFGLLIFLSCFFGGTYGSYECVG